MAAMETEDRLDPRVRVIVAALPPLTDEQCARVADLLRPVVQ